MADLDELLNGMVLSGNELEKAWAEQEKLGAAARIDLARSLLVSGKKEADIRGERVLQANWVLYTVEQMPRLSRTHTGMAAQLRGAAGQVEVYKDAAGNMYTVFSDVHGNFVALSAVLDCIDKGSYVMSLGDVIGYGPRPNECVNAIRERSISTTIGNHDYACANEEFFGFNHHAAQLARATSEILTPENKEFMKTQQLLYGAGHIAFVHGDLTDPGNFHYVAEGDSKSASDEFEKMQEDGKERLFIGHSHKPMVIEGIEGKGGKYIQYVLPKGEGNTWQYDVKEFPKEGLELKPGVKYIINVGSVGQPRDGDPRACYTTLEGSLLRFHRVPYDVGLVRRQMIEMFDAQEVNFDSLSKEELRGIELKYGVNARYVKHNFERLATGT